jgi:hypothetical protein
MKHRAVKWPDKLPIPDAVNYSGNECTYLETHIEKAVGDSYGKNVAGAIICMTGNDSLDRKFRHQPGTLKFT